MVGQCTRSFAKSLSCSKGAQTATCQTTKAVSQPEQRSRLAEDEHIALLAHRLPPRLKHLATREHLLRQPFSGGDQAKAAEDAYKHLLAALLEFEGSEMQASSAQDRAFFARLRLALSSAVQAGHNRNVQVLAARAWYEKHRPARLCALPT